MKDKELQRVNFEQAQRLKAAGFEWECDYYYSYDEDYPEIHDEFPQRGNELFNYSHYQATHSAPTVALALKWMRDEKRLYFDIQHSAEIEKFSYYNFTLFEEFWTTSNDYKTYEVAESALLDELLTILEKRVNE